MWKGHNSANNTIFQGHPEEDLSQSPVLPCTHTLADPLIKLSFFFFYWVKRLHTVVGFSGRITDLIIVDDMESTYVTHQCLLALLMSDPKCTTFLIFQWNATSSSRVAPIWSNRICLCTCTSTSCWKQTAPMDIEHLGEADS